MVKEKLAFGSNQKKKPQPKQQQVGQTKSTASNVTSGENVPEATINKPVVNGGEPNVIVEDSNNELIDKINKEIRNYRKQTTKHKKLYDSVSIRKFKTQLKQNLTGISYTLHWIWN